MRHLWAFAPILKAGSYQAAICNPLKKRAANGRLRFGMQLLQKPGLQAMDFSNFSGNEHRLDRCPVTDSLKRLRLLIAQSRLAPD
jgi:hypothetical protein